MHIVILEIEVFSEESSWSRYMLNCCGLTDIKILLSSHLKYWKYFYKKVKRTTLENINFDWNQSVFDIILALKVWEFHYFEIKFLFEWTTVCVNIKKRSELNIAASRLEILQFTTKIANVQIFFFSILFAREVERSKKKGLCYLYLLSKLSFPRKRNTCFNFFSVREFSLNKENQKQVLTLVKSWHEK